MFIVIGLKEESLNIVYFCFIVIEFFNNLTPRNLLLQTSNFTLLLIKFSTHVWPRCPHKFVHLTSNNLTPPNIQHFRYSSIALQSLLPSSSELLPHQTMDPDSEVEFHFPPFFRTFKSGRIERFMGTSVVPPSLDPATGVASKDVLIDPATGVSARLYLPKLDENPKKIPLLIYFHGGAFCIESAFSPTYHSFLNPLAAKSRTLIVSVDYRLAPEHKLPAAYHDSWAALSWAVSAQDPWLAEHWDLSRLFVGGDSAGANISHEVVVRAGASGLKIEGMIMIHPYFGKETGDVGDEDERARSMEVWRWLSEEEIGDLKNRPMRGEGEGMRVEACRRAVVCVAAEDMLKESGVEYFEALRGGKEWGGELEFVETEGEGHVFHLLKPGCEKGVELMEKIVGFINK